MKHAIRALLLLCAVLGALTVTAGAVELGDCGQDGDLVGWQLDDEGTLTIRGTGGMRDYSFVNPDPDDMESDDIMNPWLDLDVQRVVIEEGVTRIGEYAFYLCRSVTQISIPSTVREIGQRAFWYCDQLEGVAVADDSPYFTSVDGVLFTKDMTRLVTYPTAREEPSYAVPEGVVEIESCAFYNHWGRYPTSIHLPSSLATIGWRGVEISALEELTIAEGTALRKLTIPSCSITSLTIPDGLISLSIGNCSLLTDLSLPDGLIRLYIGNCPLLTELSLPASVLWFWISGCEALDTIDYTGDEELWNLVDKNVEALFKKVRYHPMESDQLIHGTCGRDGDDVRWSLDRYGTLRISGTGRMNGYWAYWYANGSRAPWGDINEPVRERVKAIEIEEGITVIGTEAFYGLPAVETVTIAESVRKIETEAFRGCTNLKRVVIPGGVEKIGDYVFAECAALEDAVIEEGVQELGNLVFKDCENLKAVTLPASLQEIQVYQFVQVPDVDHPLLEWIDPFKGCSSLESVYFLGSYADWFRVARIYIIQGDDERVKLDTVQVYCSLPIAGPDGETVRTEPVPLRLGIYVLCAFYDDQGKMTSLVPWTINGSQYGFYLQTPNSEHDGRDADGRFAADPDAVRAKVVLLDSHMTPFYVAPAVTF